MTTENIKIGNVVYNSWGWEQTSIDFYEVVGKTACFVVLRKLNATITETGFMSGPTTPILGSYAGTETIKRKVTIGVTTHTNIGPVVKFTYGSGEVWNGQPVQCSWYA